MIESRVKAIHSLTSLRGILALWVLLYHFWDIVIQFFPIAINLKSFMESGPLAVAGFFILSGYVLSYNYARRFINSSNADYFDFLRARIARIYPVHLFTLFLTLVLWVLARRSGVSIPNSSYSLSTFIENLFLIQAWVPTFQFTWNYPAWSISSEWFAYLLFPIFWMIFRSALKSTRTSIFLLIACTFGMIYIYAIPYNGLFKHLICVAPTFLSGCAIYSCLSTNPEQNRSFRYAPEILGILLIVSTLFLPPRQSTIILMVGFVSLVCLLAWMADNCSSFWTSPQLMALGDVSYSLYMTHFIALRVMIRLLKPGNYEHKSLFVRIAVMAVYASFTILMCLAVYFLVEKPARLKFKKTRNTHKELIHSQVKQNEIELNQGIVN